MAAGTWEVASSSSRYRSGKVLVRGLARLMGCGAVRGCAVHVQLCRCLVEMTARVQMKMSVI
jgi:hypothetical protein